MSDAIEIRSPISEATRRGLETVADYLIPEAHGMPAASAMDVGGHQLDIVVASRPDIVPPMERALRDAELSDVEGFVAALFAEDAEGYNAVTLAVVAGYYMHPEVHALIGYPGQMPRDVERIGEREIYQEGLLELAEKVIERGPIYRPTPGTEKD